MSRDTCLLCFAANVKTYNIKERHFQFAFEEILDFKVQAQTPPHSLCYICHKIFLQFYNFVTQTRNIQMKYNDENVQVEYPPLVQLSTVKVLDTSIPHHSVTIKQEPDVKEESSVSSPTWTFEEIDDQDVNDENLDIKPENIKCEINEEAFAGSSSNELPQETSLDTDSQGIESNSHYLYVCEICDKRFTALKDLREHKQTHIGTTLNCNLCDKTFTTFHCLKMHKWKHKERYGCDICNKKFFDKSHLTTHMSIHTDEKPHSCGICDKKFYHISQLQLHHRSHTGEKPYTCEICNKKFKQTSHLKTHMRTHTGEKPYSCDVCDMKFNRSDILKVHKRIHTGELPYSCDFCDKKFNHSGSLISHKRTHTGERPYNCDICDMKFARSNGLKLHKKRHSDKKYTCGVCDKNFTRKSFIIRHMKVHR